MLTRAIVVIASTALLAACVDSERLRSNLGGSAPAANAMQDASKQPVAAKVPGVVASE